MRKTGRHGRTRTEFVKVGGRYYTGPGRRITGNYKTVAVCPTGKGFKAVLPGGQVVALRKTTKARLSR